MSIRFSAVCCFVSHFLFSISARNNTTQPVPTIPKAGFSFTTIHPGLMPDTVQFVNASVNGMRYSWTFAMADAALNFSEYTFLVYVAAPGGGAGAAGFCALGDQAFYRKSTRTS